MLVASALLIVALAAIALVAGSPRPGPVPDPFRGSWTEWPDDGPVTTVTISGSGPSRLVEFLDEVAARCGGDVAIGAGSGTVSAPTVIEGEFSRVECRDGSSVPAFPFRFAFDEETGLLRDQDGQTYKRADTAPPSPSPSENTVPSAPPSPSGPPSTPPTSSTPSADLDRVSGSYTYKVFGDAPERSVSVEAIGSDPVTGTWTFQALPDGAPQSGPVTCLLVQGNEAFMFGPPAEAGGRGAFLWVIDGGAANDRAISWMQDLPGDPLPPNLEPQTLDEMEGWCRNAGEGYPDRENTPPLPLLSGSLSVHDAP
jgi:hypothetical protein